MLKALKDLIGSLRSKPVVSFQASVDRRRMKITGPSKYLYHSLLPAPSMADFLIARNLIYGRPQRIGACLSYAPLVAQFWGGMASLDVLQVAYGAETYNIQFLRQSGFDIDFASVDIASLHRSASWRDTENQGIHIQADARKLKEIYSPESFDVILLGQGGVDLFESEDYVSVWNQSYQLLRKPGIMIGAMRGIMRRGAGSVVVYSSSLGRFEIGGSSVSCCQPRYRLEGSPLIASRDFVVTSESPELNLTMRTTLVSEKLRQRSLGYGNADSKT